MWHQNTDRPHISGHSNTTNIDYGRTITEHHLRWNTVHCDLLFLIGSNNYGVCAVESWFSSLTWPESDWLDSGAAHLWWMNTQGTQDKPAITKHKEGRALSWQHLPPVLAVPSPINWLYNIYLCWRSPAKPLRWRVVEVYCHLNVLLLSSITWR